MNSIEIHLLANPRHQMYATIVRNKKICLLPLQYVVLLLSYKNRKKFFNSNFVPIFIIVMGQNIYLN